MDDSALDKKYFIDRDIYNCPFCNRRHVKYSVLSHGGFDWNNRKKCFWFAVLCHSCEKQSMHFSFNDLRTEMYRTGKVYTCRRFTGVLAEDETVRELPDDIDELFFHSIPSSFFTVDERIPRIIRELVNEAEECLKNNLLTGASACARKVVYELAVDQKAEGDNYEDRLKSLKKFLPSVDPTYFDILLTIQAVTSTKVHEQCYDGWDSNHLKLIISSLVEILNEIYVLPKIKIERQKAMVDLRDKLAPNLGEKSTDET